MLVFESTFLTRRREGRRDGGSSIALVPFGASRVLGADAAAGACCFAWFRNASRTCERACRGDASALRRLRARVASRSRDGERHPVQLPHPQESRSGPAASSRSPTSSTSRSRRTTSSSSRTSRRASAHEVGLQAVFRSVFPIKDFNGTSELVFVSYNLEKPKYDVEECRQRGMTLRRADQGDDAAHDLRHPRWWRAHRPRHQGAGGLLRRNPAHDGHRHVHHQRDRARRRQPAAPEPRRLLRPRQGQDPLERQAPLQRARHPVPRLVARLRVRPEGHHLRPHRPPPEDARDRAPPRARVLDAGSPQLLLQHRRRCTSRRAASTPRASSSISSPASARRATSRSAREVVVKKNTKFTKARDQEAQGSEDRSPARSTPRSSSARSRRTTSSTRRPARSSSR